MRMDGIATFLGKMFLRYGKGAFPIVILAAYSLAIPGDRVMGSEAFEHGLDLAALALVLLGMSFRVTAIGYGVGAGGSTALVHSGLYALSRNPRYLGSLLICLGIFLMHGSPQVLILGTVACVLIFACMVRAEEAELRDRFGENYSAYCAEGPRWLPDFSRFAPGRFADGFSLRRALAGDWPMIAAACLAIVLTEVHEYLPAPYAAMSRQVLIVLVLALVAFVLVPMVMRVARAEHSGVAAAPADAAAGVATRGILVNGRADKVDFLENMLSFGQQEAILDDTLEAAGLRPGEFLVDVGCGTGKLVVAAAERVGAANGAKTRLLGIDATPGIIDLALQRARDASVAVDFQVGIAEALPLPDNSADAVTSSYFFHHLPSEVKPLALREMWRVLAPGGRLIITDYARARGLYGLVASIPMRANFYEYVRPQLGGELDRIIAAEGLGEPETVSLYLGYITVMRLTKPL